MKIPSRSSGFHSSLRLLVYILVVSGWVFVNSAWASIVNEPMTNATAPGWVIGGSAYLSASTGGDPVGSGWLRLTEPLNDQAGFAFFDSPFDISQGVVIQFDYATWGGNGADGYSVYLFDGSYNASTFSVGASGGSLGYDKKTVAPVHAGLTGGYIGVGIDEYGNYSNPTEGRLGGPGQQANEVGVRGPFDHPTGAYYWLGGSGVLGTQLAFNNQLYRPIQTGVQYRKVVINLTPVAAPNYLRVDVYIQFGFNQPLTAVVTGLYVGRPVPASVKIGYAASTGGSTNYHEIRNLLIDPLQTDIDLVMTKTVSSPTVTAGGSLVYTLTARNNGPYTSGTATNMPITDTIPALLTGATWTCAASGTGASCGAASGSGSINTTATLPFNTSVSYTIKSTVTGTAPLGSTITNTATLTPPAGITDYNSGNNSASVDVSVTGPPVTISGTIYSDANHNGVRDAGDGTTGLATIYAKLFRTSNMSTALQAVLYTVGTGSYSFPNVPSYDNYTIILSTNNTLTDPTPIGPSANWIYTSPVNYSLANVAVGGANVTGLNFGLYNGSRIAGKVINDNGLNGAPANANDGILNAAETGISGVTVRLANATGATTYDTTNTGAGGDFVLYTNTAGGVNLRIYETNAAGYLSVSYNAGTTGGAYTIGGEYIQFAYVLYTDYAGVLFGDVLDNSVAPATQAQSNLPGTVVYYGHTFMPNTGGQVSFSTTSRSQAGWPALVYYQDTNCNGSYDAGDIALPPSFTASAGTPICILVKDTIPAGATLLTTDQIVTRATFTFTNSSGPVVKTYSVTDTTTVASPGPSVTVSGTVYNDVNSNGILDGGETGANLAGIYAKIFYASNLASALSVTSVVQATGAYSLVSIPTNTTYVIILSSTNNTNYDPSFPSAQWIYSSPVNYTLTSVIVGGANLTNQNFGVFNGTRIDGKVLQDDGAATGSNANNGVQNAGEPGITGQTMSVCDNGSCTSISTAVTDTNGAYSLFVPWATNFATARVTQTTMPGGYSMVTYNPGNAAGSAANLGSRFITFTFSRGTDIAGLVHSDVPDNAFTPSPQAQNAAPNASVYYAHTFTPGSGGVVSFSTNTRSQPSWPAVAFYQDTNCNGVFDGGDIAMPASLNTTAGTPICILIKDTVLSSAPSGTTDQIVTRATFTYTNSFGPLVRTYDVTDTTTVIVPNLSTSTKTWIDLSTGSTSTVPTSTNPGDVLQYTITLTETAGMLASSVTVTDNMPANVTNFQIISIPAGATDSSTANGGTNGNGYLNITNITVPASGTVSIVFNVMVSVSTPPPFSINNTAVISQPSGISASPNAAAVNVTQVSGNKPLYLYQTPQQLSRVPNAQTTAISVANTGGTQSWTLSPVLALNSTLSTLVSNVVPVVLVLRSTGGGNDTSNITVTLACSGGGTTLTRTQSTALTNTRTQFTFNLPLASNLTCAANGSNAWTLTITKVNGANALRVYPYDATAGTSYVNLPTQDLIAVKSMNAYIATWPSTTQSSGNNYVRNSTVFLRPVVSDPFGTADINSVTITIKDPNNNTLVSAVTLTAGTIKSSTSGTNTYEYPYQVPPAGTTGIWTYSVQAKEGTENTISDTGVGTFRVYIPSLLVVKSATVWSDPISGTTVTASPKAIPGAVMTYTITVTNSDPLQADNVTITDSLAAEIAAGHLVFNTRYVDAANNCAAGSGILVNGTCNTNASDADNANWNVTTANAVTVSGLSIPSGGTATIKFQAIIQ